jgi:hypothetical protein
MRIVRPLGEGGMGRVWLVERRLGAVTQRAVLKRPRFDGPDVEAVRVRFADEVSALARIGHGNVVRLLDAGDDAHGPWFVIEHVDGVDVAALLDAVRASGARLGADELAWIAHEAARGLAAAHAVCDAHGEPSPVLHRDLSPQNVFLSRAGEVKVGDFGIAWAVDRSARTTTGVVVGNLRYVAPEQLEGRALGPPTDVYGVGRVLEEMLALAPDAPAPLRAVAARATCRAPDGRYDAMDALADALLDAAPTLLRGRAALAARVDALVRARDRVHGALAGLLALERPSATAPALAADVPHAEPPPAAVEPPAPTPPPAPRARARRYLALSLAAGAGLTAWITSVARPREAPRAAEAPAPPRPPPAATIAAVAAPVPVVDAALAPAVAPLAPPAARAEVHRAVARREAVAAPAPAPDAAVREGAATLQVSSIPYALVSVDHGAPVGTPHTFTLAPGEHQLRAAMEGDGGALRFDHALSLRADETRTLAVTVAGWRQVR